MKKLIKTTIIAFTIGIIFSLASMKFLHYKMEEEILVYLLLSHEVEKVEDINALCDGLLKTNPTQENILSCNTITEKVEDISRQIKERCPYISFYKSYIGEIK